MQKRLFLMFFPMMLIPALAVMLVDWQSNRRQLAVVAGPGLEKAFDSSLELARRVLEKEKDQALVTARNLAHHPDQGSENNTEPWWLAHRTRDGSWQYDSSAGQVPAAGLPPEIGDPSVLVQPRRWATNQGSFILASARKSADSGSWVVVARPVPRELSDLLNDVSRGGAGVRQLRRFYSRLLRSNLALTLGGLTLLLLVVSLVLSHLLARYLAHPLQELSLGTERVAAGDFSHQVQVSAPAELGRLVRAFNRMTRQLQQGREDLRRAERVAAWQGVARRLAHEIKNPLTPITLAMHRIGNKSDDPTITSCVQVVLEEATNLGRLADEFSLYAKLPSPRPQRLSAKHLHALLDELARFYLVRTRVKYGWRGEAEDFSWWVDQGQLRQVLSNLIKNGNEAMQGEGYLAFELTRVPRPSRTVPERGEGPWIRLTIRDTGPGLPGDAEQVFEPYLTTKATGTGLGLPVARRIMEENGGCLWAESSPDGAAFHLELPDVSWIDERSSS